MAKVSLRQRTLNILNVATVLYSCNRPFPIYLYVFPKQIYVMFYCIHVCLLCVDVVTVVTLMSSYGSVEVMLNNKIS